MSTVDHQVVPAGEVEIDGHTEALTVTLRDATGAALWSTVLPPGGERR